MGEQRGQLLHESKHYSIMFQERKQYELQPQNHPNAPLVGRIDLHRFFSGLCDHVPLDCGRSRTDYLSLTPPKKETRYEHSRQCKNQRIRRDTL